MDLAAALRAVAAGALLAAALPGQLPVPVAPWVLANERLEVRIDAATGEVVGLRHRAAGMELLDGLPAGAAWRLEPPLGPALKPTGCLASFRQDAAGQHLDLRWSTQAAGLAVEATVSALKDGTVAFAARVPGGAGVPGLRAFDYPLLSGVGSLGRPPKMVELVHPVAMGFRIQDPAARLPGLPLDGLYPQAFAGCPVQLWAYTVPMQGGFSLEVHDGRWTAKSFPWERRPDGLLETRVRWRHWDEGAGQGLDLRECPVVLRALDRGWEEAAEAYRAWAAGQPWCAAGPIASRPAGARLPWLEGTGLATVGISVRDPNQELLFPLYRMLTGLPVLHLGGFWWPGGKAGVEWYGGYRGWHDSRARAGNLAAARGGGDRLALWLFDLYFSRQAPSWGSAVAGDPVSPWQPWAVSPPAPAGDRVWSFMCPAAAAFRDLHGWREAALQARYDPDAWYFDIGPALAPLECRDPGHGHPAGAGRWMVQGLRDTLARGRAEAARLHGGPVAHGTELMTEPLLDLFDFYYARAGGGPLGMLEMEPFRQGVLAGWAEDVPLFAYVYHEYGPVRLDGNVKLAAETGELFFWSAGRVAVRGGIPIVDHTLSAAELLPAACPPGGLRPPARAWYETFLAPFQVYDDTPYGLDEGRAWFLGELGRLRIGPGRDFLVLGRMRPTPPLAAEPAAAVLGYRVYNTFNRNTKYALDGKDLGPEFAEQGSHRVPAVLHAAWTAPDGRLGVALLDVAAREARAALDLDPAAYLAWPGPWQWRLLMPDGSVAASGNLAGPTRLQLTLPCRRPCLLEVR